MRVNQILESVLYAKNLVEAEEFYTTILGLKVFAKDAYFLFFKLENSMLLIFNKEHTLYQNNRPRHGTESSGHLAFKMKHESISDWRKQLQKHKIKIEKELRWENGAYSIYFRDPAGNSLELATPDLWHL